MNPHKVLGVSNTATKNEIRKIFLTKAKQLHPDSPTGNGEKFKELMEAYNILIKNPNYSAQQFSSLNFRDIVKKYERPFNNQTRTSTTNSFKKVYSKESNINLIISGLIAISIISFLWHVGDTQTSSKADDLEAEYKSMNSKIKYEIYEDSLSNKKIIKF